MTTRRRAGRGPASAVTNDSELEQEQGRPIPQPKPKKPTVAQNAQAIETLSHKISGVDAQLSTMNTLLAQLAATKNSEVAIAPTVLDPPIQSVPQTDATGYAGRQHGATHTVTAHCPPQQHTALLAGQPPLAHLPGTSAGQPPYPLQGTSSIYSAAGMSNLRARHHTTPAGQPAYTTPPGWPSSAPGPPPTAHLASGAHHHTLTALTHPTHVNPWDHPATLQDMETDPTLTRRVAEALTAVATPFAGIPGKHAQFPHHLVTRGSKKAKDQPGGAINGGVYMGVSSDYKS